MKPIPLTQGLVALVDDADAAIVSRFKWHAGCTGRFTYAMTTQSAERYMHRLIMQPPPGMVIDHLSGDTLDNRRANLRICTNGENLRNRHKNPIRRRTPHRQRALPTGVCKRANCNRYEARVCIDYKNHYLGLFATAEEAAAARLNFTPAP